MFTMFVWRICLLIMLMLQKAQAQAEPIVGIDICACSPSVYEFTVDFLLTCENTTVKSPGIEDMECLVEATDFGENVTDYTPVAVMSVDLLELDQSLAVLAQQFYDETMFRNSDKFTYTSVIAKDSIDASMIPKGIQLSIFGQNALEETLKLKWMIRYNNDCGIFPILTEGQHIGWTIFSDLGKPSQQICPKSGPDLVPTQSPTLSQSSDDQEPSVSPTMVQAPTLLPTAMPVSTVAPTAVPSPGPSAAATSMAPIPEVGEGHQELDYPPRCYREPKKRIRRGGRGKVSKAKGGAKGMIKRGKAKVKGNAFTKASSKGNKSKGEGKGRTKSSRKAGGKPKGKSKRSSKRFLEDYECPEELSSKKQSKGGGKNRDSDEIKKGRSDKKDGNSQKSSGKDKGDSKKRGSSKNDNGNIMKRGSGDKKADGSEKGSDKTPSSKKGDRNKQKGDKKKTKDSGKKDDTAKRGGNASKHSSVKKSDTKGGTASSSGKTWTKNWKKGKTRAKNRKKSKSYKRSRKSDKWNAKSKGGEKKNGRTSIFDRSRNGENSSGEKKHESTKEQILIEKEEIPFATVKSSSQESTGGFSSGSSHPWLAIVYVAALLLMTVS